MTENKQEDRMTKPTEDELAAFKAAWHDADERGDEGHRVEAGLVAAFAIRAQRDEEAHAASRALAFEGALLIEEVRQIVGGLSDPSREDLNNLFDQCSDYSDKWNTGHEFPLPHPKHPSFDAIREALNTAGAFCGTCSREPGDRISTCRDCSEVLTRYTEAILAIMPKPADTEETNR